MDSPCDWQEQRCLRSLEPSSLATLTGNGIRYQKGGR